MYRNSCFDALMFIMQKSKIVNIVFVAVCYYCFLRHKYVYCSYTILDKIISESEHLERIIDERTNLKRKIFMKVNASYRIYSPGCARIDEFIYETLIKLKVDSESLAKSSMSKQLIDTIDLMRDVCDDDCKKEEVCKHFNKALFVNHKPEFCKLFVDHIYQKKLHLRRRYRTYINLRNDMVDTFFSYKSSFESHKEPYLHVKNILPWDITENIMAAFYQLRVACDETDCFTQFMSDTRYYDVIGSKNSKELNILNMAIVYSVLNLLVLIGSCIIEVSHHKTLLAQMTELENILLLSGHTDQKRRRGILNPENCRRLFDCYLAYSAYIHEFVKFPELNDHFHSPPFFYEYDVRCDVYTMSDGSEFYRPSKNWCDVGRMYFTRYESQCDIFMLKHAIFHDRGERLMRTLNLLFMTALSEPESPFGSSCMLLLFNAIVKSK